LLINFAHVSVFLIPQDTQDTLFACYCLYFIRVSVRKDTLCIRQLNFVSLFFSQYNNLIRLSLGQPWAFACIIPWSVHLRFASLTDLVLSHVSYFSKSTLSSKQDNPLLVITFLCTKSTGTFVNMSVETPLVQESTPVITKPIGTTTTTEVSAPPPSEPVGNLASTEPTKETIEAMPAAHLANDETVVEATPVAEGILGYKAPGLLK